jgi:hypothetical protein
MIDGNESLQQNGRHEDANSRFLKLWLGAYILLLPAQHKVAYLFF